MNSNVVSPVSILNLTKSIECSQQEKAQFIFRCGCCTHQKHQKQLNLNRSYVFTEYTIYWKLKQQQQQQLTPDSTHFTSRTCVRIQLTLIWQSKGYEWTRYHTKRLCAYKCIHIHLFVGDVFIYEWHTRHMAKRYECFSLPEADGRLFQCGGF